MILQIGKWIQRSKKNNYVPFQTQTIATSSDSTNVQTDG